jgi:hypothetical protein
MQIDLREIPVVWINLDTATQNAKIMNERFEKYGFKNTHRKSGLIIPPPYPVHPSISHFMGCGQSHIDILSDTNYDCPLLILEDDIEFANNFNPVIEVPDDSDGVYLGISHGGNWYKTKKVNDEYYRIAGVLAAHAILYINPKFREDMKNVGLHCLYNLKQPWDMGTAAIQHTYKIYTPIKPLVYQSNDRENANKWQGLTDFGLENRESEFE